MTLQFAFLLFRYFPYGGAQRDCIKIAREALTRGHRVRLYVAEWEGDQEAGIDIRQLSIPSGSNHDRLQQFASHVTEDLARNPVDATLSFHRLPGFDAMFAADPCDKERIRAKFGIWLDWLPRYRSQLRREAQIFDVHSKTKILLLNPVQRRVFQRHYATPDAHFVDIGPSVDNRFNFDSNHATIREQKRAELQLATDQFLLLMVGSDFVRKGVDRAVRALASLPAQKRQLCQLYVAGNGNQEPILQLASQLGIRTQVHLLGGRDDVPALMHAADLLLQPARMELAGMTIVEALCSGLPVIASGECGYAVHVDASSAGVALTQPFEQTQFDNVLNDSVQTTQLQHWQHATLTYVAQTDLRGMARQVVDLLETIKADSTI